MHPILMSSDFDPIQVAIVVMAVIFGFIKWLWENWQQNREAAKRKVPRDPEEQRMREAAWRKQTGRSVHPPLPQSPAAPSPWDELRKAWKELKETTKQAQMPQRPVPARQEPKKQPPPVPQRQPVRKAVVPAQPDMATQTTVLPSVATADAVAAPQSVRHVSSNPMLAKLQGMRRDPALMRQAILMQEILGPPKALQTSNGPAI